MKKQFKLLLATIFVLMAFLLLVSCGDDKCEVHADVDKNAKCDNCGERVECTAHVDVDKNLKCDVCAIDVVTVTFDSDGGSEVAPITKTYGAMLISLPTPTHEAGIDFLGWYYYNNGNLVELKKTTIITENITVTAKWSTPSYPGYGDGVHGPIIPYD